ncbi:Smr/MutS family protein [Mycoplasma phocoenae]|uniref:Smr/MutS family protein n=1 Tax=Mycoplasma phocoenae TaxID=754517 RepID=A0A858U410_9MOLU|nr:Smr/MutS family protein [Mycoplasma phocoenae]QJG66799.1 Smr/MutS family protein [Mycoplasma phocoenae]
MKKIDLHGLDIQEVTSKVLNAIYSLNNSNDDSVELITGKGTGALKLRVEELLDEEGVDWDYYNADGTSFIVYKTYDDEY